MLRRRHLFVEPLTRSIDIHTKARDGSEFIRISRLADEEAKLDRKTLPKAPVEDQDICKRREMCSAVYEFTLIASKIDTDREKLKTLFPMKSEAILDVFDSKQDWCTFCLGSKLCSEIYNESYLEPSEEIAGHSPVLSIVIHFDPYTLAVLLKYFLDWFFAIGMEESLGAWVYAVVACMNKLTDSKVRKLVETFYDDCEEYLVQCDDESEINQLYLISGILDSHFDINLERACGLNASFNK